MDTIAIFDILLLAAIAGFILFRLWSVLGTRTGQERSPERPAPETARRAPSPAAPAPTGESNTIPFPRATPVYPPAVERGLDEIAAADRNFDPAGFAQGALSAHERVVESFAAGARDELRNLLGSEVFAAFEQAIKSREAQGLTAATVIVKQGTPQIVGAALKGRSAEITMRYETEIIQYSKNAAGEVVEGSESKVNTVIDRWTWTRDVKSSDPNWKLVDTETGD